MRDAVSFHSVQGDIRFYARPYLPIHIFNNLADIISYNCRGALHLNHQVERCSAPEAYRDKYQTTLDNTWHPLTTPDPITHQNLYPRIKYNIIVVTKLATPCKPVKMVCVR